jgi:protein gp37
MSEKTGISWTDHTFNPWWGCHKISAECTNCYAETTSERFHPGHWGLNAPRKFFSDKHWNEPLKWDVKAKQEGVRRRVFCASMSDVFETHPREEVGIDQIKERRRLWELIQKTPNLDWLLLTKRPENFYLMLPWITRPVNDGGRYMDEEQLAEVAKPWPNVWLGVTAGVRSSLDRVVTLRATPSVKRFISCEPLLEHITAEDWDDVLVANLDPGDSYNDGKDLPPSPIDWLIVGDESGPGRRPAQADWVRTARDAAARNGVAFHFKQWAGGPQAGIDGLRTKGRDGKIHLPMLDGQQHAAFPAQ